jgi:hypothetical protein
MSTNPASLTTVPKMIHLGAESAVEFHVAPGERVLFAGPGEFAVIFPDESPFNELVFSNTHARTLPARQCEGRSQYFWARAGMVGTGAKSMSVEVSGVVAPMVKPPAEGAPPRGGSGVIVVP